VRFVLGSLRPDPAAALKLFLLHPQSLRLTLKLDALVVTYFFQQPCYPL
jgi:hypothetical protein